MMTIIIIVALIFAAMAIAPMLADDEACQPDDSLTVACCKCRRVLKQGGPKISHTYCPECEDAFRKKFGLPPRRPQPSNDHGEQGGVNLAPNPCRTNAILAQPAGPSAGTISRKVTP